MSDSVLKKITNVLYSIYRYVIVILFLCIIAWLFLLSIFGTSKMTRSATEYTFYTSDNVWIHIAVFAALVLIMFLLIASGRLKKLNTSIEENDAIYRRIRLILLCVIGAISFTWVVFTQSTAGADQMYVLNAAYNLRHGDYSDFMYDGYIARYPVQIGLLFIEYLVGYVVGDFNYIFWQIINVFFIVFTYKFMTDILEIFKLPRLIRLSVLLLGILFFPWILYASFIYGTVPGLFFSVAAFKQALLMMREKSLSRQIIKGILCGVCMMMGAMLKSNYLIFMIGLILYITAEALRCRKVRFMIATAMIIVGYMIQAFVPKCIVENITGYNLDGGASAWNWIAIGLHTTDGKVYADGWYSVSISDFYAMNDYDTELEAEASKALINVYLNMYAQDSDLRDTFIFNKVASQWNNPTFQCFWITNVRDSNIERSQLYKDILSVNGTEKLGCYLNIVQSLILLGCVFFAVGACLKKRFAPFTLLQVTFIGGFIFHLFWEGKCQYTLPYFMLLIPLACVGFYSFAKSLAELTLRRLICAGVTLTALIVATVVFNRYIITDKDDGAYEAYYSVSCTDSD